MKREVKMLHLVRLYTVILIILFIGIVIYINAFALRKLRASEYASEQELLGSFAKVWNDTLENNTVFVENFIANSEAVARLNVARRHEDKVYALQDIKKSMDEYALLNYGMNELFFYYENGEEKEYLSAYQNTPMTSRTTYERIDEMIALYQKSGVTKKWVIEKIDGENYLIYINEKNGNYAGCWCLVEHLIDMAENEEGDFRHFFITYGSGISRTDGYLDGEAVDLFADSWEDPQNGERCRQIAVKSDLMDIYFVEHIEISAQEASLVGIRNIMVVLTVILGGALILFSAYMEYFLYRPIRKLVSKMVEISEGNFEAHITDATNLREIRILNQTFNTMVDEIKNLKITVYEDALREQKTKLAWLQMQIRPHFLVNALNTVYSMINMKREQGALDMCIYLSRYFQFLYNKPTELILITEEIEHVSMYIKIQKLRRPEHVFYEISIDEACGLCLLPPLLLQTFVENSFKYGGDPAGKIDIFISAKKEGNDTVMTVRDHGPGFPGNVLADICSGRPVVCDARECVGVFNACERLKLFFGARAGMNVYNDGGAVVVIRIPGEGKDNNAKKEK